MTLSYATESHATDPVGQHSDGRAAPAEPVPDADAGRRQTSLGRPRAASDTPGVDRDQLDALSGVVEDLAGQFELRPLLVRILRHAAGLLGCSSGSICIVDEPAGTYRKEVDLGVACRSGREFPLTEGVTGEILRAGGPVTFAEYSDVRGGHIDPDDRVDLHATIGVPIRWAGAVIGACIVFSRDPGRTFEASDVTLLELFAGHAGLAMVNARMHAQAAELARAEATGRERERIVRDVHDSVSRALASVVLHLGNGGADGGGAEGSSTEGSSADGSSAEGSSADGGGADGERATGDEAIGGADIYPSGIGRGEDADAPGPDVSPIESRDRVGLARRAALSALTETRRTVLGVRPALAQAPTIEQAIAPQVDWARSTGLDIRLVVAGPPRSLPVAVVDVLFGVAHQAITSIVAHADARTARVGLVYSATDVVLLIQDDGVGFDSTQLPRPDGSRTGQPRSGPPELADMARGAERLGGTLHIDATPGWGTTIRAAIPYAHEAALPDHRSTVLVVEHRPLVRAGLVALLGQQADLVQVVGEIDSADDVLHAYRLLDPDVVLIDVALPGGAGQVTATLRRHDHAAAVVAIGDSASCGDVRLRETVQAGARAAVMIDADVSAFTRAIGAAARGDALFTDEILQGLYSRSPAAPTIASPLLTPRELQVRDLVSQGLPDKLIAEQLHISVKTVEKHVGSALRKSGARNRTELAGMAGRSS